MKNRTLLVSALVICSAGAVSAARPWTPADTNCWAWWDPSDAANMTTNTAGDVTELFDLSGREKHLTTEAGKEPTPFTRLLGTKYGLDFNNPEGDKLRSYAWYGLGSNGVVSFYVIHDHDYAPQHNPSFFNLQDDFYFNYQYVNPYGKRTPSNGSLYYSGGPYTNTHIFSAHLVFDPSTNLPLSYFNAYVDGTKVTTNKAYINQLPPDHAGGGFTVMTANNQDIRADGVIGEIVIINDASDVSRQTVEGYLAHKWGLVDSLPEDHPHKKYAPGMGPPGTTLVIQ